MNNQSSSSSHQNAAQESIQRQMQEKFNQHVKNFTIDLEFPAEVKNQKQGESCRTSSDIIQHRLLESGILFTDTQTVGELTDHIADFIQNLERSGCFHAVQVRIGGDGMHHREPSRDGKLPPERLQVILNERNWYRLYIGGGLKQEGLLFHSGDSSSSLLPKVQFETSGKLLNLTGFLDTTSLQYTIDQTSSTSLMLTHERPLFSYLSEHGGLYTSLVELSNGSQISLALRAHLDTVDHEWTRSYKEYQRMLGVRLANSCNVSHPEMSPTTYAGIDWSIVARDVIPKRHATLPYACDASNEIVQESGTSLKHSLSFEYRTNGTHTNNRFNPTQGTDYSVQCELAGPPGDVGFVKCSGGVSLNQELIPKNSLAIHSSFHSGFIQPLSFHGLCGPPTISDRFFMGGSTMHPQSLRGFCPAGIGPRAKSGGSCSPNGDALGGDFYYTATLAASIPFPGWPLLSNNGVRLFGFTNLGTLTALQHSPLSILQSTRLSIGGGIAAATPFGRLECTYAVPLRYGPRDARRSVQMGFGFSFG